MRKITACEAYIPSICAIDCIMYARWVSVLPTMFEIFLDTSQCYNITTDISPDAFLMSLTRPSRYRIILEPIKQIPSLSVQFAALFVPNPVSG